ncbi:MAG: 16S rRNA (guanine(527)-N(7))-methyltransferase RsmG [Flavobacteriaceae bacterium]
MPASAPEADRARALALIRGLADVSRETEAKLDRLAALVGQWQRVQNLVAPSTLPHLWTRHIADSAQLHPLLDAASPVVDLGSGAGFPGLVLAILGDGRRRVTLIEANGRKAAFLREAARQLNLAADVRNMRIEAADATAIPARYVTARALAALPELVALAAPWLEKGATALFLKGQDVDEELQALSTSWDFGYEKVPSVTDPAGSVVALSDLTRKALRGSRRP